MANATLLFIVMFAFSVMVAFIVPAVDATGCKRASMIYSSQWLSLDIDRNYVLWGMQ